MVLILCVIPCRVEIEDKMQMSVVQCDICINSCLKLYRMGEYGLNVAQDRSKWWATVNIVMNLWVK